MEQNKIIDPFGRTIDYLRVSVTDRCDFRCTYCMSENMTFLPKKDLLTLEELTRLCEAFIDKGIKKIRITGGEPLVRKGITELIQNLGRHTKTGRLNELTITTNGSQLHKYAKTIKQAGVERINVSLDTLNPQTFQEITRWGKLDNVLRGIEEAKNQNLKVKINAVALKDVNEDKLEEMMLWAHNQNFDFTIIETMPMGEIEQDRTEQYVPITEVRKKLEQKYTIQDSNHQTPGPARYADVKETGGRIGFITPMSNNFCEGCNRVRLTCTGTLFMCLGQNDKADLKKIIRNSESNQPIYDAIDEAISRKPKGHEFIIAQNQKPAVKRHMSVTGG